MSLAPYEGEMRMSQKTESPQAAPAAAVVLRLLNGALRGGEFVLETGTTLIVASPPDALLHGAGQTAFPDNAIFVPVDDDGGNFEVDVFISEDGAASIALRDLNDEAGGAGHEAPYVPNTVRRIAGLDIALRWQDEVWSDAVRNHGAKTAEVSAAPQAAVETDALSPRQVKQQAAPRATTLRIAGLALLATLLAGTATGLFWMQSAPGQAGDADAALKQQRLSQAAQVATSLRGAGQYRVLLGRDSLMYVFAADEREASWARQSVARSGEAGKTRVLLKSDEGARIERLLDRMAPAPAYHTVRLGNPAVPEIWLSRERAPLSKEARQALAKRLGAALPYAERVEIRFVDDAAVAGQAEAGLERLGVPHKRIDNGGSITMSIRGALPDGELQKIRSFVETFYRQWGTRYVHYSVEMEDDLRKGKSFEYGDMGSYVKTAPSHWDFSAQS
jgi:type III secretion system PrgH/EprH family protein